MDIVYCTVCGSAYDLTIDSICWSCGHGYNEDDIDQYEPSYEDLCNEVALKNMELLPPER